MKIKNESKLAVALAYVTVLDSLYRRDYYDLSPLGARRIGNK